MFSWFWLIKRLRFYHFSGQRVESLLILKSRIECIKERPKLVCKGQLFFKTGVWNVDFHYWCNVCFSVHPTSITKLIRSATKALCHNLSPNLLYLLKSPNLWGHAPTRVASKKVGHSAAQNLDADMARLILANAHPYFMGALFCYARHRL